MDDVLAVEVCWKAVSFTGLIVKKFACRFNSAVWYCPRFLMRIWLSLREPSVVLRRWHAKDCRSAFKQQNFRHKSSSSDFCLARDRSHV